MFIIHLFSMCSIHIDKENKNKLYALCNTNISYSDEIIVKCVYDFYSNSLLDNTPLPKVLVELICVWINDEVVVLVNNCITDYLKLYTKNDACISFCNVRIKFCSVVKYISTFFLEKGLYDMEFSDNILQINNSIRELSERQDEAYKIYAKTVHETKKFTNTDVVVVPDRKSFKIVNHELWLIACNIIYVLQDNIEKMTKN